MKPVAIKKGQSREKAQDLREMGTLRCDGCGEEFVIFHSLRLQTDGALNNKPSGLKKSFLKSTNATGSTPTGSNCRTDRDAEAFAPRGGPQK
jgi:hypothetical protein